MEIRKFDEQEERVESGPIQFGKDWPGVFMRGDNALYYAMMLETFLKHKPEQPKDILAELVLHGLVSDLRMCDERINNGTESTNNSK